MCRYPSGVRLSPSDILQLGNELITANTILPDLASFVKLELEIQMAHHEAYVLVNHTRKIKIYFKSKSNRSNP